MKAALGVSWNDAKPRRMSALLALAVAAVLTFAMAIAGHGTALAPATSDAGLLGGTTILGGSSGGSLGGSLGGFLPSGATWS